MNFDIISIARKKLEGLTPFKPGKPIEEVRREYNINDVIKLASNENPLGPSALSIDAINAVLQDIRIYPDGNCTALKQTLATHHKVQPEQITLGNGSEEVMTLLAHIFVDQADEVIMSNHEYITYSLIAKKVRATPVIVPTKNWAYDLDAMLHAITPRTRMLFIANPKNPTGTRIEVNTLVKFLNLVPNNVLVILDEAYFEYVQEDDHPDGISLLDRYANLIVTRTFSKIYSLASLRIGYCISSSSIAFLLNCMRMPFNVNKLAQVAAQAAIQDKEHVRNSLKIYQEGKAQLQMALSDMAINYLPSFGNFVTIELNKDAQPIYQQLLSMGIIVRPLETYGMPKHLRVTIGTPQQNARFIDAFKKVMK